LIILFTLLLSSHSHGGSPTFSNIESGQVEGILKDFASNFFPSTVTPASGADLDYGMEMGFSLGLSDSKSISDLSSGASSYLPKLSFHFLAFFPKGISTDFIYLSLPNEGLNYKFYSLGPSWSLGKVFTFPIDIKLQFKYSKGDISFSQPLASETIKVQYSHSSLLYGISFSKKILGIFEPYFGFGHINTTNTLASTGSSSIFDAGVSALKRDNVKVSGLYTSVGIQLNLLIFNAAMESTTVHDNKVYLIKFAFYF
jgi:hypothetical protein